MTEEKIYTQKQMDAAVNKTRIEERYIANQLMGNLGIPVQNRRGPDGKPIYEESAAIVMGLLLKPKVPQEPELDG